MKTVLITGAVLVLWGLGVIGYEFVRGWDREKELPEDYRRW